MAQWQEQGTLKRISRKEQPCVVSEVHIPMIQHQKHIKQIQMLRTGIRIYFLYASECHLPIN